MDNREMEIKIKKLMRIYFALFSLLFFFACNHGPQSINYGKDECAACKMTIMDKKYGAEMITAKGKVFKFDDVICMIEYLNSGVISQNDVSKKLIIDYQKEESFIEVEQATYFNSTELHSPMNGNTAAFINKEEALKYQNGKQGVIMDWNEVYNKLR